MLLLNFVACFYLSHLINIFPQCQKAFIRGKDMNAHNVADRCFGTEAIAVNYRNLISDLILDGKRKQIVH